MAAEDDLREQMIDAFEGANYPISSPMDLVPRKHAKDCDRG